MLEIIPFIWNISRFEEVFLPTSQSIRFNTNITKTIYDSQTKLIKKLTLSGLLATKLFKKNKVFKFFMIQNNINNSFWTFKL